MFVPVLIFLAGLSVGAIVGARWLPDLAAGQVGGLAFFVVCGLLGTAIGLAGVHVFLVVQELERHGPDSLAQSTILALGLRDVAYESGSLLGFAAAIYLLAPPVEDDDPAVNAAA